MKTITMKKLACATALCGVAAMLCGSGAVFAERVKQVCNKDVPNTASVKDFGYYDTQWREWPGEVRLDKTFPAAVGREQIPAPAGKEAIPAPEIKLPPGKTEGPTSKQPGISLPSEGILPPLGPLQLPEGTQLQIPEGTQLTPPKQNTLEEPSDIFKPFSPAKEEGTIQGLPPLKSTKPKIEEEDSIGGLRPVPPKAENGVTPLVLPPLRPEPPKSSDEGAIIDSKKMNVGRATNGSPVFQGKMNELPEDNISINKPRKSDVRPTSSVERDAKANGAVIQADWNRVLEPASRSYIQGQPRQAETAIQSNPPKADGTVAFNGYCPVELSKNERWVKGDAKWTEVYQGVTYRFSSDVQRECFLSDPERYVPAYGGRDPVLLIDGNETQGGKLQHCVTYNGRLYMFSGPGSLSKFHQDPDRYSVPLQ
jgi:YHS domain-containing protein